METLNLVSLWGIPVVFVIENNGYSMGTSLARSSAEANLAHRADGFDIEWDVCEGHDVFEVREYANRAMSRAREEMKPSSLKLEPIVIAVIPLPMLIMKNTAPKRKLKNTKKTRTPSTCSRSNSLQMAA